jgi:hypothetical protein
MRITTPPSLLLVTATILLLSSCGRGSDIDPTQYYAPKLLVQDDRLVIAIPVEVGEQDGKLSFVKLFEHYGFSGNGPSIEQVVRHNVLSTGAEFDSEGDAFLVRFSNKAEYMATLEKLRCMEDVHCLSTWLRSASSIFIKE